ncbi:MAG: DUF2461 domain-containing protein [Bacteroidetes bacterium]|nr:DUF2461 domain-containing protein [Bacteroidota bacterium]
MLSKSIFDFLKELANNNDRDWFTKHKDRYQAAHAEMKDFRDQLLDAMSHIDEIEKIRLHRIYRDIRFSKDKTPYKTWFSGGMSRATKMRRGSYYFHIEPGNSFVGGGFWGPNSDDMKLIRTDVAAAPGELKRIVSDKTFKETFGTLRGEQLKTAPRGYSVDHPAIEFLRYKQFLLRRDFSDKEVLSKNFIEKMVDTYAKMRPLFDYMTEVLTTDENGQPLY